MSEQPVKKNHDDFDPLAEARRRANIGRQIYEKFMDDGIDKLSVQDINQGEKDMIDYLESRPDQDDNDRLHDPKTGAFVTKQKAGEVYTPASSEFEKGQETDEYMDMSLSELAKRSAKAELRGDRGTMISIDDAIDKKMDAMDLSESITERDGSPREKSEREIVLDRVLNERQDYIDSINGWRERKQRKTETETGLEEKSEKTNDWAPPTPGTGTGDPPPGTETTPEVPTNEKTIEEEIGDAVNRVLDIDPNEDQPEKTNDWAPPTPGTGTGDLPPGTDPTREVITINEAEPSYEISETTREAVNLARDRFARLSAARRGETLGKSKEELVEAKQQYEAAILQANEEILQRLIEGGATQEEAHNTILNSSLTENTILMAEIARNRVELSNNKRLAGLYQWFGRQSGLKGRLKKMAATAAVTAPLGVAAGIAGVALVGPITGALIAGAMARGITKSLASGRIDRESNSNTLAEQERIEDVNEATVAIRQWMIDNPGATPPADLVSEIAQATTNQRLSENRRRTAKMVTIGALVGAVSGYAASWIANSNGGEWIKDLFGGRGDVSEVVNNGPGGTGPGTIPGGGIIDVTPTTPNVADTFLPGESISSGTFKYPWSWAESNFGGNNATPMLETLIQRAKDAGINIDWNPNPGGSRYIEVNGASDGQTVINVLKNFIKPGELKP